MNSKKNAPGCLRQPEARFEKDFAGPFPLDSTISPKPGQSPNFAGGTITQHFTPSGEKNQLSLTAINLLVEAARLDIDAAENDLDLWCDAYLYWLWLLDVRADIQKEALAGEAVQR